MRFAFVASNPSHLGSDSPAKKNLSKWVRQMELEMGYTFFNVSNQVTPDNRPLKKSEYELDRLKDDLKGIRKVVALGTTAAEALTELGIQHFALPHPSPKNRTLNDKAAVSLLLSQCKQYLES